MLITCLTRVSHHTAEYLARATYLVELLRHEFFFLNEQVDRKGEQEEAVPDVTEHDREQEGEGHHAEHDGVDFTVARNAVRVDNVLVDGGEFVRLEIGGRRLFGADDVQNRRHQGSTAVAGTTQRQLHLFDGALGTPALSDQTLAAQVVVEQVHRVVDPLLFRHLVAPALQVQGNVG